MAAFFFFVMALSASIDSIFEPDRYVAGIEVFCADLYLLAGVSAESIWRLQRK